MNAPARLLAIGMLGLAVVGGVRTVADPPQISLELPSISLPEIDDRPRITLNRGTRVTFDEPTSWNFDPTSVIEVEWCDGRKQVIEGPAKVDNVCAFTPYD